MTVTDPDLGVLAIGQHRHAEDTPIYREAARACRADRKPEPTTPTPDRPEEDS